MAMNSEKEFPVSAAFFCPQSRAPDIEQLSGLHAFLSQNKHGEALLREVSELLDVWTVFAEARGDVEALSQGPVDLRTLRDWAIKGECGSLAAVQSGIVALPLLVVLQVGQYLRYLEFHRLSHLEVLGGIRDAGGAQGYCGGLPSAIAIACAKDENELVHMAAVVMRLLVGVGAFAEAVDEGGGCTTLALRLKNEAQADDLIRRFPGTHVSAVTDPRSVSIVGPASTLHSLYEYACSQQLQVQKMDIRGKVHNPENQDLAAELCCICERTASLWLPAAAELRVCVRSNKNGKSLQDQPGSLAAEIITTVLASKCDWYSLLVNVAEDVHASGRPSHTFVVFGLNDCVPMTPFHSKRLRTTKFQAHSLIPRIRQPSDQFGNLINSSYFPDNTIAVVGASCRLPGASNLDELWQLLAKGVDCHQEVNTGRFNIQESFRSTQSGPFANERKFYGNFIDDVERFDHSFFGESARAAANMDPQQRILLELSFEALESSGYIATHRREAGDNVGCFIGASLVEYLDNTNAHAPTAYTSTGTIRAFLCGRLSYQYGWSGPAEVIDTACSSSLVAINRACKAINSGECSMALAGGVNVMTGINNFFDLGKAGFLSTTGQCKPFDEAADGYCRSDGAGLVVLKSMKQAIADGDEIMALIPGIATNQGGLSASITVPHSIAQQSLYRAVLRQSGLQTEQVGYIESHGTGTQAGDPLEMESIRSIFGSISRPVKAYIGSIKGNLGHCETAAGIASLLKVLAMIKHGQIPPQTNHIRLNLKIPPLEPDRLEIAKNLCGWDAPLRAALVNSYGAAGSNCALLCCEMPHQRALQSSKFPVQDNQVSFPIIISAATKNGVKEYAQALGAYIQRSSTLLDVGDISFTLTQKRRRHKYFYSTMSKRATDLAQILLELDTSNLSEYKQDSKFIVLSFSGQNDNKVQLDRNLYEDCAIFRSYINACDSAVQILGFDSIIPGIFQSQPIDSIVILQCSIFAVQYACAQSLIDAGLKVGAVIGHSFGELTALAVSGVLSLSDGIKLVASRAHLMEIKWGSERGAMISLACDSEDFDRILLHLSSTSNNSELEIACYNAPRSLVAVGSGVAVDALENILRSEPEFQKIRFQRLDTSHGFHSALTEPILSELAQISQTLQWNEPKIPIEVCTINRLRSLKDYSVSSHARDPVYFYEAVRRLEESYGSCLWLEAGINTPIIPMIRKATRQPEIHDFHALKPQNGQLAIAAMSDFICHLWNKGISLAYWNLLSPQCKSVWLPPYQFEKPSHWRENIDRAIEMQQQLQSTIQNTQIVEEQLHMIPQLVTRRVQDSGAMEFLVNTHSQRFRKIVRGHAVRSRPLCPASMYMECVTMAVLTLIEDVGESSLVFENVNFHSALGDEPDGDVVISLEENNDRRSWKFSMQSTANGLKSKQKSHVNGIISLNPAPMFDMFTRLISGPSKRVEDSQSAERFMSNRAYGLFALVVDYDHFFRGIQSIAIDGWEAVATISVPENQPNREESTSWGICDTVTIDSFIQVVGLLMNSSDAVSRDEVMVMVGIDRAVISPACKMNDLISWRVYTKFSLSHDGQPMGDVFVSTSAGKLVAILVGCRFTKLLISKLERALDMLTSPSSPEIPKPQDKGSTASSADTTQCIITPSTSAQEDDIYLMKELLSEYISVDETHISKGTILSDLGLDSLAAVEFVEELALKFRLAISSEELTTITLDDLHQRLGFGKPETKSTLLTADVEPSDSDILSQNQPDLHQQFMQILVDSSGAKLEEIELSSTLSDLGVDSLSVVDLKEELELSLSVSLEDFLLDCKISDLMIQLKIPSSKRPIKFAADEIVRATQMQPSSKTNSDKTFDLDNPFEALRQSDAHFASSAREKGFHRYWSEVAPFQDELLCKYIIEALLILGIDLSTIPAGAVIPDIPRIVQKYDKLLQRIWEILAKSDIVVLEPESLLPTRSDRVIDLKPSHELLEAFRARFPEYAHESDLINLTGPRLADCLVGKADPVSLMFGRPSSLKIMENFYWNSPMMSTLTEQLTIFLTTLLCQNTSRPVRILEVGAGTGGTTKRLAEALNSAGIAADYTFTDISPSLVAKAKNKFKEYPWIKFSTFNLEKEVPEAFRKRFDVVISANCVHATTDRMMSCRRLREVLTSDGLIVLSEVTRIIDWYDICFGLLDGWWLAEGRKAYPLQPAQAWMSTFDAAGFSSMGYSQGATLESTTQQLLVACDKKWNVPAQVGSNHENYPQNYSYNLETLVYKVVDGVQISADVYFPKKVPHSKIPIALMIHGGGHMTLSRRAVRSHQTRYLIDNGILPISIDYRLCPEIDLINGPFADVCDAYQWILNCLPKIAADECGLQLDTNKIVVIGWSTGGQLAMSVGWLAKSRALPLPVAVLSFYAPVDFESGELDENRLPSLPARSMKMEDIIAALSTTPITNYESFTTDRTNLGWVRPGDPRSELILSLFKEGNGLPLLINGLPKRASDGSLKFVSPTPAEIASISPLAQLRTGNYKIPTFIIHGTSDKIASFASAKRFVGCLKQKGIHHGFLELAGVDHIHDLTLRPGSKGWKTQVQPGYQFLFDMLRT